MANARRYRILLAIKKIREAQGCPTDPALETELEVARDEIAEVYAARQEAMKAAYMAYWMVRRDQQQERRKWTLEERPLKGIGATALLNAFGLTWPTVKVWVPQSDMPRILKWNPEMLLPKMEEAEAHEVMEATRQVMEHDRAIHTEGVAVWRRIGTWEKRVEQLKNWLNIRKEVLANLIQKRKMMEQDRALLLLSEKEHVRWLRSQTRARLAAARLKAKLRMKLEAEKLRAEIARVRQERTAVLGGVMEQVMRMRASEEQETRRRMLEAEREKKIEAAREEALIRLLSAPDE